MTLVFHQLFEAESSTYTYLVADGESREAALIDPVLETASRDQALLAELGLMLVFTLETHCHADHVTGANRLRCALGSEPVAHKDTEIRGARLIGDGETIRVGALEIKALHTPGHTSGDVCYLMGNRVFTGDTLLIGGCGRTDFQQGCPGRLYDSIHAKLFTLPDATLVFPAHDYKGLTQSTIGAEKRENPRLAGTTREQFMEIMENLGLPYPKQIDRAVPANLEGGANAEPFAHPVKVGPQQFFNIPEAYLVACAGHEQESEGLPRPADRCCKPEEWQACMPELPLSHTIALVGETGEDCLEMEGALTRAGYDVVILAGGRAALDE